MEQTYTEPQLIDEFEGQIPDTGGSPLENKERCIAFNTYVKTTFTQGVNRALEWINSVYLLIKDMHSDVAQNKEFVNSAKAHIEESLGFEFAGAWNPTNNFTGKITYKDNALWLGLAADVGNEPTEESSKWKLWKRLSSKVRRSTDYTASNGDEIYTDTSDSSITITLPNALEGAKVRVIDQEMTFDVNNCLVVSTDGTVINKIEDGTHYEIDVMGATRTLECIKNKNDVLEWRTV